MLDGGWCVPSSHQCPAYVDFLVHANVGDGSVVLVELLGCTWLLGSFRVPKMVRCGI